MNPCHRVGVFVISNWCWTFLEMASIGLKSHMLTSDGYSRFFCACMSRWTMAGRGLLVLLTLIYQSFYRTYMGYTMSSVSGDTCLTFYKHCCNSVIVFIHQMKVLTCMCMSFNYKPVTWHENYCKFKVFLWSQNYCVNVLHFHIQHQKIKSFQEIKHK